VGGYGFQDSGAGVWTPAEKVAEAAGTAALSDVIQDTVHGLCSGEMDLDRAAAISTTVGVATDLYALEVDILRRKAIG
jgi:hypothetical protein